MIKKTIALVIVMISFSSCVMVKEYEKVNLSDPDMELSSRSIDRFETTSHAYREAAAGANGGKTGGGCGCN